MIRYGISTWIVRDVSADKAIELMAANGFREVEISADAAAITKEWEKDPERTTQRLERAGFEVLEVHTPEPGRSLDALDDALRLASLEANYTYFDLMRRCGAKWLVVHLIGARDKSPADSRAARKAQCLESLKALADRAGRMGIGLAVENLPGGNKGARPCDSMGELREMIAGLGGHVRLCFDIGHAVMKGFDPVQEIKTAGDQLISLHLHDVNSAGKDHFIPGEGVIDWQAVLSQFDAMNFTGIRTIEISPPQGDVEQRVAQTAALRRQWESR